MKRMTNEYMHNYKFGMANSLFENSKQCILGFLSDSYIVEVTYSMKYREDDADHSVESWFVKVIIIFFD